MGTKITIEDLSLRFKEKGYELLSTEYKNAKTVLQYLCEKHSEEIQETTYGNFRKSKNSCRHCTKEYILEIASRRKYNFDYVKNFFEECGYSLLEEFYVNCDTKMRYICNIHNTEVQEVTFYKIHNEGNRCKRCSKESMKEKLKTDFNHIKNLFEDMGYILTDDIYVNAFTPMKFICPNHKELDTYLTYSSIRDGHGCIYCGFDNIKGKNHHNWNGGKSTENMKIRSSPEYIKWRKSVFERDNYTCQACLKRGINLQAHHIENFSKHANLRFDIGNGATLCKECHDHSIKDSFHNIYGRHDNSKEQFEEYIKFKRANIN